MAANRALFLDRDGVINQETGYLHRPEDVRFVPGVFELCRTARDRNFMLVVITNQSGIARGLYSEADFHQLMAWMATEFAKRSTHFERYYFCPHHPVHGIGQYRRECEDRKPGPGMLLRAAQDLDLALDQSVLVGDRCSDIEAGLAAGVGKCFLLSGTEPSDRVCPGIYEPVAHLETVERFLMSA